MTDVFDSGSVSKRNPELSLKTVIIKMKENQRKSSIRLFIWEYIKLIVDLTRLFDAIIVLDRRHLTCLTGNYG